MELFQQQIDKVRLADRQPEASFPKHSWMLPHDDGVVIKPIQSLLNVRTIKSKPANKFDLANTLRSTGFGRFYRNHLKRHALIRGIVHWMWRHGKPFYINHIHSLFSSLPKRRAMRWRPLIKLSDYRQKQGLPVIKLADKAVVATPEPRVYPGRDQDYLTQPHEHYQFPEINVTTIVNGMVFGGSNLIRVDDIVICHDLYDFKNDYTSEELHARTLIDPGSSRIRWLLYDKEPEIIPAAAAFVDACAPNFAHWLTEVLPRVVLFCADQRFKDIPIVVTDGLHENIMESLLMIAGTEREVILLPVHRGLVCKKLYMTSMAGYVPFEWRRKRRPECSHGIFSPPAFDKLRNYFIGLVKNADQQTWPEKIFLRRNAKSRNVLNREAVEKLLLSKGYAVIEPEKLTFWQQVALFSNAKSIVSSSGAALANMIFAPPGSNVSILISKHPDTIYWYWQDIACASGKTVKYTLGQIGDKQIKGVHASFSVDLDDLNLLLSEMETQQKN